MNVPDHVRPIVLGGPTKDVEDADSDINLPHGPRNGKSRIGRFSSTDGKELDTAVAALSALRLCE